MMRKSNLYGLPIRASLFVPEFQEVPVPPRNRREHRRRSIIARRRKKAGRPVPSYTRQERGLVLLIDGCLYAHPNTVNALHRPTTPTPNEGGGDNGDSC